MLFTTVRNKEKDYDIYLKSEITGFHSQQEHEKKMFISYFGSGKKLVPSYFEPDKTLLQLFGERKKVDPCYLETKKCSSQLLGARKKIMTSI